MTAELLRQELEAGSREHFLGHIGGDDFLAIVDAESAPALGERIRAEFQRRVTLLYEEEDRRRGWICAPSRDGSEEVFSLMTLSVAMAFVEPHDERHYSELLDALSAAKRDAKLRKRAAPLAAIPVRLIHSIEELHRKGRKEAKVAKETSLFSFATFAPLRPLR